MTVHLEGALRSLQELLALGLQRHGPLLDGTEAGVTAGGSIAKTLVILTEPRRKNRHTGREVPPGSSRESN